MFLKDLWEEVEGCIQMIPGLNMFFSCDSPVGGLCPSTGFVPQAWIHHKAARSLLPMRLTVSICFNHFDKLDQLANPPIWEMIHNAND